MMTDWVSFPADLFGLVLARLPLVAATRSAAVCKSWYALAVAAYKPQAPLIRRERTSYFYSISDDRYYDLDLDLSGLDNRLCRCIGVHEDWMAVGDLDKFTTLYNPFSKARIELPFLLGACFHKMVFSSSPGEDPNCQAAVLRLGYDTPVVGFCSVHENKSDWIFTNTGSRFVDIVFYNRSLLGVTMEGELKSVNLDSLTVNLLLQAPPEQPIPSELIHPLKRYRGWEDCLKSRCYQLFVSDGELLMLCSFQQTPLALFKANWELGLWQITDSLKGKAIFLAHRWFFSLGPALPNVVEKDTIYYFHSFSGPDMFRLKDRMYFLYGLEKVFPKIGGKRRNYETYQDYCMLTPKLRFRLSFEAT